MTKIVTTIGPASQTPDVLKYFKDHDVAIARLNFSHGTADWHVQIGELARNQGFELMVDLAGPKVLVGELGDPVEIQAGKTIIIEKQRAEVTYPTTSPYLDGDVLTLPSVFELEKFVKAGHELLIDDGKIQLDIEEVLADGVVCKVKNTGLVKNHKGINLPDSKVDIDFLVDRDRSLLKEVLPKLKPEIIAPSFVQTKEDIQSLLSFVEEIKSEHGLHDYNPKICTKVEMGEAIRNLDEIIEISGMIMIARGDLALETKPLHIQVPILQDQIAAKCKQTGTPFIVATQMLESMMTSPVPSRAEVSDIYRAVHINQANYIMLSGETAAGSYGRECVKLMSEVIKNASITLS
jgi:pyruvate kinase